MRRFAQKSHDHRGTPEVRTLAGVSYVEPIMLIWVNALGQNPGRVVTLIHKEDWDHFSGAVRPNFAVGVAAPC